ncbi:MAG: type II toxin-antitoxin system YafQ family toxin [Acidobacteriota bacterium]|nr:type II toxin-antitoxin system YafQ family toxin [Acidobacteriota bacterium]
MRTIRFTSRFKMDFSRVQRGLSPEQLRAQLQPVVDMLVADTVLPIKNRDHALRGEWAGFRDCHIRPDLVLIYRKFEPAFLELSRLGSHNELFKK